MYRGANDPELQLSGGTQKKIKVMDEIPLNLAAPEGIEPPSKEPESSVLSIKLRGLSQQKYAVSVKAIIVNKKSPAIGRAL